MTCLRRLLDAAAVLGTAAALAACGGGSVSPTLSASQQARCAARADRVNIANGNAPAMEDEAAAIFVSVTDVSKSTGDERASYLPDMLTFVRRAAHDRGLYYADAFGGAPRTTARYPVRANFAVERPGFAGNRTLAAASRDCDAASLEDPLRTLANQTPSKPGSPLLEMLSVASDLCAQQPGPVPHVALFTDAELVESDFDVRHEHLTPARLSALVAEWAPRLRGLANAHVYVVGAGRGTGLSEEQLDEVHQLIDAVLAPSGGKVYVFDSTFGQGFIGSNL